MYKKEKNNPRVSIGMPVYNGEKYIREAIESILNQSFTNFELIISDNASTDRTKEICLELAKKDPRIQYYRNDQNLGASFNFNKTFELSSGEYFKWAAHDDICDPNFLESCVEVLEKDPSVILCYTKAKVIDENNSVLLSYNSRPKLASTKARERFFESICVDHPKITDVPVIVFGVIRRSVLKKTPLIGNYASSDGVLLGELSLCGRFYEVPEFLFYYRRHPDQSLVAYRIRHELEAWYDPEREGKTTFPNWRLMFEHFNSIRRVEMNWHERSWCYLYLVWYARLSMKNLVKDLIFWSKKIRHFYYNRIKSSETSRR